MQNNKIVFEKSIQHNGEYCDVEYYRIFKKVIDSQLNIYKVHTVCFDETNKILLVHHRQWSIWGLPGGTLESGETYEETIRRECFEEGGITIKNITPFSIYTTKSKNDIDISSLLVITEVDKKNTFTFDPAGSVTKILWSESETALTMIEQRPLRQKILSDALNAIKRYANK